jgi:hypothetical protein
MVQQPHLRGIVFDDLDDLETHRPYTNGPGFPMPQTDVMVM